MMRDTLRNKIPLKLDFNDSKVHIKTTRPFLKWAGGKSWLIPMIQKYIPSAFITYHEPFLGSGSIFLALQHKPAFLSDLNKNLIDAYLAIRDCPDRVIKKLKSMPYNKEYFYHTRDKYKPFALENKAAKLIYLNRTCWNGLYRENSFGKFNVPFGVYKNPTICDQENIMAISKILNGATLKSLDFEDALSSVSKNDFIFLDPPYISSHRNNGFLKYNNKIFSWDDQVRLANLVREIDKKGSYFLMTNANHQSVINLYKKFNLHFEIRYSSIAASNEHRKHVEELIIRNY